MNEYRLKDIRVGMKERFSAVITPEMEDSFRLITGDINPLHCDDVFARENLGGGGHVVFGMLTASLLSTLAGVYLPGKYSLIHSVENISFLKPVRVGESLDVMGEVESVYEELRMIKLRTEIRRLSEVVLKAKMKVLVLH